MSEINLDISKNFSKIAKSYEDYAIIQKYSAQKLTKYLTNYLNPGAKILDLGSGTGLVAKSLTSDVDIFLSDLSFDMLLQNNFCNKNINCDFENLPFKEGSFDILISSFSLQWIQDFEKVFSDFYKILKPNGILCFSLPVENSFLEIKEINPNIINNLQSFDFYRNLSKKNKFNETFCKKETLHEYFQNPIQALKSFKNFGANYKYQKNDNNLFSLRNYKSKDNNFKVSWEVGYFIFNKD